MARNTSIFVWKQGHRKVFRGAKWEKCDRMYTHTKHVVNFLAQSHIAYASSCLSYSIRSELLINGKALETNLQKSGGGGGGGGGGQCPPSPKVGEQKVGEQPPHFSTPMGRVSIVLSLAKLATLKQLQFQAPLVIF